jgi:hypothetical protein
MSSVMGGIHEPFTSTQWLRDCHWQWPQAGPGAQAPRRLYTAVFQSNMRALGACSRARDHAPGDRQWQWQVAQWNPSTSRVK